MNELHLLLRSWRNGSGSLPAITEVFLAALGTEGERGFQCEIGFGDGTAKSFQSPRSLYMAVRVAFEWVTRTYGFPFAPGSTPEGEQEGDFINGEKCNAARAFEREACAGIADAAMPGDFDDNYSTLPSQIAAAIRARGGS